MELFSFFLSRCHLSRLRQEKWEARSNVFEKVKGVFLADCRHSRSADVHFAWFVWATEMNGKCQTRSVTMTLFFPFAEKKSRFLRFFFRFSQWITKRQAYRCFEEKRITSRLTPVEKIKWATEWRVSHVEWEKKGEEKEKRMLRKIIVSTVFLIDRKHVVNFVRADQEFHREMSRIRWEFHVIEGKFDEEKNPEKWQLFQFCPHRWVCWVSSTEETEKEKHTEYFGDVDYIIDRSRTSDRTQDVLSVFSL